MSESIDRRQFLQSATLAATAATAVTGAVTGTALAADAKTGAKPTSHQGPLTRRWTEQRWLLDNTIRSVGMDWDQPRSVYLSAPCGPQAAADFAAVRARIQKYADAAPAFEAAAKRREGVAKAALEAGDTVTARENYFTAAIHWGAARGRSTRTTRRTSSTTRASASATALTRNSPSTASRKPGSPCPQACACPRGSTCRRATRVEKFRW
jgi:hypothetical protein